MTSNEAYIWVWLPDAHEPVVAGRLVRDGNKMIFNYGKSYLGRAEAIPIYAPELPLQAGAIEPPSNLDMAGCLRDGAPDAWGRRVILNRLTGRKGKEANIEAIDELTYLLESGSERAGALDFQCSPTEYVAREAKMASLDELVLAAENIEQGIPLTPDLDNALLQGTALGGARPKAMLEDGDKKLIAKFSSATDIYNVVKAEFIAMRLAEKAGLCVAPVRLVQVAAKNDVLRDVLLVERFDRVMIEGGWRRKAMVSALTMFGLDEMMARYASYAGLAEIIRHRFSRPKENLRELFGRMVFNIICGNTDDHARNHAAFWDGRELDLTPAYDICPQYRSGQEASQAMLVTRDNRMSHLANCREAAPQFLLKAAEAEEIIERLLYCVRGEWEAVCDEARLSEGDQNMFWGRMFLNPYVFEGAVDE